MERANNEHSWLNAFRPSDDSYERSYPGWNAAYARARADRLRDQSRLRCGVLPQGSCRQAGGTDCVRWDTDRLPGGTAARHAHRAFGALRTRRELRGTPQRGQLPQADLGPCRQRHDLGRARLANLSSPCEGVAVYQHCGAFSILELVRHCRQIYTVLMFFHEQNQNLHDHRCRNNLSNHRRLCHPA